MGALHRLGARSISQDGTRVAAHFAVPVDDLRAGAGGRDATPALIPDLRAAIRSATSLSPEDLHWDWRELSELEELWHREFRPGRVSSRIVVLAGGTPSGRTPPPHAGAGDIPLRLAPSPAFGTPQHPTTRSCLALLDGIVQPGNQLLDVGSGSGILAVASALLGAERVRALEMDPVACDAIRANARLNHVSDRIVVEEIRVDPEVLRTFEDQGHPRSAPVGGFHGIMANLEPPILLPLIASLAHLSAPGGWLLLSGVPLGELGPIRAALDDMGLGTREERLADGWWTALLER